MAELKEIMGGARMVEIHCKEACPIYGFKIDCSDL